MAKQPLIPMVMKLQREKFEKKSEKLFATLVKQKSRDILRENI